MSEYELLKAITPPLWFAAVVSELLTFKLPPSGSARKENKIHANHQDDSEIHIPEIGRAHV